MQINLIIIVIGFVVAFLIEARHDYILAQKETLIRLLASKEERIKQDKLKDKWHKLDWFYLFIIGLIISLTFDGNYIEKISILVAISMLKILVFNIYLNKLLGNDLCYLGSGYIESKFKGKEILYYSIAAVLFIASILYLWIM